MFNFRRKRVMPGLGLSLGITLFYLGFVILLPLAALLLRSAGVSPSDIWVILTRPEVVAAFRLNIIAALVATVINMAAGLLLAWVLVRYDFPGRKLMDALIDIPFAMPTAVAGIALTSLYDPTGWLGQPLGLLGIKATGGALGVIIAFSFVSLPFVVRTVQPVLAEVAKDIEEAAASLGADRWQTLVRVIFPLVLPSILTGGALAMARAFGEYGSVIFISANIPLQSQIVPHLIVEKLEAYEYAAATVLGSAMLVCSFIMLLALNLLQRWSRRYQEQ